MRISLVGKEGVSFRFVCEFKSVGCLWNSLVHARRVLDTQFGAQKKDVD